MEGPDDVKDGQPPALDPVADDRDLTGRKALRVPRSRRDGDRALHLFRRFGKAKVLHHMGQRVDGAAANVQRGGILDGGQPAIGLEIALKDQIFLKLLAVERGRVEGVVVFQDAAKAGTDQVGAADQVGQDLRPDAHVGFRMPRIVARGAFEVEPDGDQVFRHDLPHPAGHGGG